MDWTAFLDTLVLGAGEHREVRDYYEECRKRVGRQQARRVIVSETRPQRFFAAAAAAAAGGAQLFLFNPQWGRKELASALAVAPDAMVLGGEGAGAREPAPRRADWLEELGPAWLVPTGGSTGAVRFAVHTVDTLASSVEGFGRFFGCGAISGASLLPPWHVSGLMPWLRAAFTGGKVALLPSKEPWKSGAAPGGVVSLAPTQLVRWCEDQDARGWLRDFDQVLVGGGPVWPWAVAKAAEAGIRVTISYGMTETAAMAAAGVADRGRADGLEALPHLTASIVDEDGQDAASGKTGRIAFEGGSLFLGYAPGKPRRPGRWVSDDTGRIDESGRLHLLGRLSDVVISGGEKIFPLEVEEVLWQTGRVRDVSVIPIHDEEWGEVLAAFYVPVGEVSERELAAEVRAELAPWKVPKKWVQKARIDRSPQGKLDRQQLRRSLE